MQFEVDDFSKFIIIGDRVLVKPRDATAKTRSGLYLPPGIHENEKTHSGWIIKTGPGYPIPSSEIEESWKEKKENLQYIPLQVQNGDLAIFLQKQSYEIEFNKQKYVIIPHAAILMVIRDESLFE